MMDLVISSPDIYSFLQTDTSQSSQMCHTSSVVLVVTSFGVFVLQLVEQLLLLGSMRKLVLAIDTINHFVLKISIDNDNFLSRIISSHVSKCV